MASGITPYSTTANRNSLKSESTDYKMPHRTGTCAALMFHIQIATVHKDNPPLALALRSRMDWITGTRKMATMPPANPLL